MAISKSESKSTFMSFLSVSTDKSSVTSKSKDYKCPFTSFTDKEIKLVMNSWYKLHKDNPDRLHQIGIKLLLWMFKNVPGMRNRFTNIPQIEDDKLVQDRKFLDHARSLICEFDGYVKLLNKPDLLKPRLDSLVKIHLGRQAPIGFIYFDAFHRKFHAFIAPTLNEKEDSKIVELWCDFIGSIADMFRQQEGIENNPLKSRSQSVHSRASFFVPKKSLDMGKFNLIEEEEQPQPRRRCCVIL